MALLESSMPPLGTPCPDFSLEGVDAHTWKRDDFTAPALLIVVMCNHCPYVQAVDERINLLAKTFAGRCDVVGINSNDPVSYPEDDFASMRQRAKMKDFVFPYLFDETQTLARALGAVCTPDFFLYDQARKLSYRGRLDDNWKDPGGVKRQELREAIEALLGGQPPSTLQHPSMGCSIKWREAP